MRAPFGQNDAWVFLSGLNTERKRLGAGGGWLA